MSVKTITEKNLRLLFLLNSCLEFNEYKGSDLMITEPTLVKSEKNVRLLPRFLIFIHVQTR